MSEGPSEPVGVETRAHHSDVGDHLPSSRLEHHSVRSWVPAHHGGARQQGGAGVLEASDQDAADLPVVDDAGLRDMDRRDGRDVWLELAHLQRRQPADREAVGQTPVVQGAKPGQLSGGGGHDQLAGPCMGHPFLPARSRRARAPLRTSGP